MDKKEVIKPLIKKEKDTPKGLRLPRVRFVRAFGSYLILLAEIRKRVALSD